jgi:hypothetical protein
MPMRHPFDEAAQGMVDIGECLTRTRLGIEHDEVHRVAVPKSETDLGFLLESSDARTVPGARIEHDDRGLCGIETIAKASVRDASDAQQSVVRRPIEPAGVENDLITEVEERRLAGALMRQQVVGALPQGVDEENGTLPDVALVGCNIKPSHDWPAGGFFRWNGRQLCSHH